MLWSSKSNRGQVVLIGTVDKPEDVQKANQVKEIQGVKKVDNQLKVSPNDAAATLPQDSAVTPQDRELNARIRERLGAWLSARDVEGMMIKTNKGEVVIIGTVEKPEDVEKVNYQLKDFDGINKLDNQLKVKR